MLDHSYMTQLKVHYRDMEMHENYENATIVFNQDGLNSLANSA